MVKTHKYSRIVLMNLAEIRSTKSIILQITDTQTNFDTGHKCYLCEVVEPLNYYPVKSETELIREICKLNDEKRKAEKKIARLEKALKEREG